MSRYPEIDATAAEFRVTVPAAIQQSGNGVDDGWPTLDGAALHGLAGDIVTAVRPHSEADPVGILLGVLIGFGALVGPGPHALADGSRHPARLNAVLVGATARARKGTVLSHTKRLLQLADPDFAKGCICPGGLASGEGLIEAVRDDDDPEGTNGKTRQPAMPRDPLRRLLVFEPEFSRVLKVGEREGNILSPVIREAWDDGDLSNLTRHKPQRATGAHVCILANITERELGRRLTDTEIGNGFANRFLFVCVRRSQLLPEGGALDDLTVHELARRLRAAASTARTRSRPLTRTAAARDHWKMLYEGFPDHPDLVGDLTARAEAQALRLSVTYALLDGKAEIDLPHLEAAYAVWRYCEASTQRLFGHVTGNPDLDRLVNALRQAPNGVMDRADIHSLFSGHRSSKAVDGLIEALEARGIAKTVKVQTGGRPREEVHLVPRK